MTLRHAVHKLKAFAEGTTMGRGLTPREMLARLVAFPTVSDRSNLGLIAFVRRLIRHLAA